jgi:hypothetical protein
MAMHVVAAGGGSEAVVRGGERGRKEKLTFSTSHTLVLAYTSLRSTSLISSRLDACMTMVLPAKEKVDGSSEVGTSLRTAPFWGLGC